MDKNKNKIPDWLENLIYWGTVVAVVGTTLKKVMNGEVLTRAFDVTSAVDAEVVK